MCLTFALNKYYNIMCQMNYTLIHSLGTSVDNLAPFKNSASIHFHSSLVLRHSQSNHLTEFGRHLTTNHPKLHFNVKHDVIIILAFVYTFIHVRRRIKHPQVVPIGNYFFCFSRIFKQIVRYLKFSTGTMPFLWDDNQYMLVDEADEYDKNRFVVARKLYVTLNKKDDDDSQVV